MTIRIVILAVALAAGCNKKANWQASRDAYCDALPDMRSNFDLAMDPGNPPLDRSGLLPFCNHALAGVREAVGLLRGLRTAERALYAGAADDPKERAAFVTGSHLDDTLIRLWHADSQQFLRACASGDLDSARTWLAMLDEARKQAQVRIGQQLRDCRDETGGDFAQTASGRPHS